MATRAAINGILWVTVALSMAGCGSGSSSGGPTPPPPPPTALSYPSPTVAAVGNALPTLAPVVSGSVNTYSVTPALPAGLALNPATGAITGTPTAAMPATDFTVTGANASGSTTFVWRLSVNPAANAGTSITVDAGSFVTLDASASATTAGHALSYAWHLRSAPSGSLAGLASSSSQKPIFKADVPGAFIVDLTVQDGALQSAVATVEVTVRTPIAYVPPATPAGSQVLSDCQEITTPGNYTLSADVTTAPGPNACLWIHDTHDVLIDCASHSVTEGANGAWVFAATNVQHLTVQKCQLTGRYAPLDHVSDGTFLANSLNALPGSAWPAQLDLVHAARFTASNNHFSGAFLRSQYSDSVIVQDNSFVMTPDAGAVLGSFIWSYYGTHVQILRNDMDGKWDGLIGSQYTYNGADDGIILQDETDALVEFNTIRNVFDTGIEWLGVLNRATVRGNAIANTGISGFGGWYWASELNCKFIGNNVRNGMMMYWIYHTYGIRPAGFDQERLMSADAGVLVQDNIFDANVSSGGRNSGATGANIALFGMYPGGTILSGIPGERQVTDADLHYSNNSFQNNVFDPNLYAPWFGAPVTPGIVTDLGNNYCNSRSSVALPIVCH
jgi:hypothetical protein